MGIYHQNQRSEYLKQNLDWIYSVCRNALSYAENLNYQGYSKYDALNSPILNILTFNNKYLRLLFTQAVMRSPLNFRPLFAVPKQENPKGIGLFAQTYANFIELFNNPNDLHRMKYCLNFLLENKSPGDFSGPCWGYNFEWQTPGFLVPRYAPNMVVSTMAGEAFLKAFKITGVQRYLDTARGIIDFIHNDLNVLHDNSGHLCYSYTPFDNWRVINISALAAGFMSGLYMFTKEDYLIEEAHKLLQFVIDKQTDYGAWYYTDPTDKSRLSHDNYHTGYILDSIDKYKIASGDMTFQPHYNRGLSFYSKYLFLQDGAPKFLYNRTYPIDIHGSAQGILTFSRAGYYDLNYLNMAIKIAKWASENMLCRDSHFYYQKKRYYTKRFSLMRWAQAWMCYALSSLILSLWNNDIL